MRKPLFALLSALVLFASCAKAPESPHGGMHVATSIFPVYDIARNIAGERAGVSFLVPAGANPHVYEPRPSEVRGLAGTDLFIGINEHFDGWMARFIPDGAAIVYLAAREENPHVWLSVKKAAVIAQKIADALAARDPGGAAVYRENLRKYAGQLAGLDAQIAAQFARCGTKSFIQWHAAWDYFAADYGLTIFATIESGHGKDISLKSMRDIAVGARKQGVRVISLELQTRNTAAETLREETGGTIVRLDSVGDPGSADRSSYIDLMKYNAAALSAALR